MRKIGVLTLAGLLGCSSADAVTVPGDETSSTGDGMSTGTTMYDLGNDDSTSTSTTSGDDSSDGGGFIPQTDFMIPDPDPDPDVSWCLDYVLDSAIEQQMRDDFINSLYAAGVPCETDRCNMYAEIAHEGYDFFNITDYEHHMIAGLGDFNAYATGMNTTVVMDTLVDAMHDIAYKYVQNKVQPNFSMNEYMYNYVYSIYFPGEGNEEVLPPADYAELTLEEELEAEAIARGAIQFVAAGHEVGHHHKDDIAVLYCLYELAQPSPGQLATYSIQLEAEADQLGHDFMLYNCSGPYCTYDLRGPLLLFSTIAAVEEEPVLAQAVQDSLLRYDVSEDIVARGYGTHPLGKYRYEDAVERYEVAIPTIADDFRGPVQWE